MPLERLQKILAQAGVASRRTAEKYIQEGRVRVNGKVVRTLGAKADLDADTIEVDGFGRLKRQPHVYIALHKPEHVVTTLNDPEGRMTVADLLAASRAVGTRQHEAELPRVFPVGRLDFDAEGLVLLTNDGALAQRLLHPRYHVPKTYVVKIKGRPEERALIRIRRGLRLRLEDGRLSSRTQPAGAVVLKYSDANTWLEITIVEGRHHQVKLMCLAVGHRVLRLIRTDVGGIPLDDLPAGAWRFLSTTEVARLRGWTHATMK
ncbi:pseudouridine synthase, partial [Myxococcota bacterium]